MNNSFVMANDKNLYQRGANQNLRGLNTQFGEHFGINNKIVDDDKDTYKKYDVIPGGQLKSTFINKPHKLVVSFDNTHVANPIILNEAFRDVVSVKLLNGIFIEVAPNDTETPPFFITLSINELNNIYSSNDSDNALLNSFATLEYDKTVDRDKKDANSDAASDKVNIFKNKFGINGDIKYFDPPLNSLDKLNISLFDNRASNASVGVFQCKLEFIVETKEKLRVY